MKCNLVTKQLSPKTHRNSTQKSSNISPSITRQINSEDLSEKGRLQYFFHCPKSKYPIRDVLDIQGQGFKTEPYIEECAENFCNSCWQPNIQYFINSDEKYLFLFTICKNQDLGEEFFNKAFIIGYIKKERVIPWIHKKQRIYAVQGETKIFQFKDSFPLHRKRNPRHFKRKKNRTLTKEILEYFSHKKDIRKKCVDEIKKLQKGIKNAKTKHICT